MGTQLSPRKGAQQPPLSKFTGGRFACIRIIRGLCLLWPNGWMDQNAISYRGRPRPRPQTVVSVLSVCLSCMSVLSVTLVYCGQTVGWIKMKFGTQVSLGPGHIMLNGNPAPPPKGAQPPNFQHISVVAKWLDGSRCHLVGR